MATSPKSSPPTPDLLTSSSAEPPARDSAPPDEEMAFMTRVLAWPSNMYPLLRDFGRDGWCGKTSAASSTTAADGTLAPSSGFWRNSGMVWHGESLTFNSAEHTTTRGPSPSPGGVSSLSDILETGDHLLRYCLSPAASRGVLRRAAKYHTKLPPEIIAMLENAINQPPQP